MSLLRPHKTRVMVYLSVFFLSTAVALTSYVNSSYLSTFFSDEYLGLIYSFAAIVTVFLTLITPRILKSIGFKLSAVIYASFSVLGFVLMITGKFILPLVLLGFVIYYCLTQGSRYITDLYLENLSTDNETGSIRGVFMTMVNLAWLISPFLTGLILGVDERYFLLYFIAAWMMIPFIFIFGKKLPDQNSKKISIDTIGIWIKTLFKHSTKNKNITKIIFIDLLLNIFYTLMVIYIPLHLHNSLGFSWQELGFIFTIMLAPFILLTYPLGQIADRFLGEKELLIGGFLICGLATLLVGTSTSTSIFFWAFILFMTRVGAATIEIMKETYLFKIIDGQDGPILSLSRTMFPLAYIVGPILGSIILLFGDYQTIFLVAGLGLLILGTFNSLRLVDTK